MKEAVKTFSTAASVEASRDVACAHCGAAEASLRLDCGGFRFFRCERCGLLRQQPQPLREAVVGRYGADYLSYQLENERAFRDLELLSLRDAGFYPAEREVFLACKEEGRLPRCLDVGCSTGALIDWMRERGWRETGIEICAESAEWGRRERGLDIRACDLEHAELEAESFDLVHASHLIEHLNSPDRFLEECARLLRPRGFLFLTTPNADGFQAKVSGPRWRSAIGDHLFLFSKRTLQLTVRARGFSVERVRTWGGWPKGAGLAFLKPMLDRAAKAFGTGDVMILRARKDVR